MHWGGPSCMATLGQWWMNDWRGGNLPWQVLEKTFDEWNSSNFIVFWMIGAPSWSPCTSRSSFSCSHPQSNGASKATRKEWILLPRAKGQKLYRSQIQQPNTGEPTNLLQSPHRFKANPALWSQNCVPWRRSQTAKWIGSEIQFDSMQPVQKSEQLQISGSPANCKLNHVFSCLAMVLGTLRDFNFFRNAEGYEGFDHVLRLIFSH